MFAYEGVDDKDMKFTIINEDTNEISTSVWEENKSEDRIVTLRIPKRTRQNLDFGIKNNYKIIAGV